MAFLALSILVSFSIFIIILRNESRGAILYLCFITLWPIVAVNDNVFRIEHITTPALLSLVVLKRAVNKDSIRVSLGIWLYIAWFIWLIVATFLAGNPGVVTEAWVSTYGYLRPLLVALAFANLRLTPDFLLRFCSGFTRLAVPLSVLALGQTLNSSVIRSITEHAYTSPGRDVFLRSIASEQSGYLLRAISVFENVSYAATYFLLACVSGFALLSTTRAKTDRRFWFITASCITFAYLGGVFTMSATFIGGIAILTIWRAVMLRNRKSIIVSAVLVLAPLAAFLMLDVLPVSIKEEVRAVSEYEIERLTSFQFLHGRFFTSEGAGLLAAWEAALARPITGWGYAVTDSTIIVNDSVYLILFYTGGTVGCSIFAFALLSFSRLYVS